MSAKKLFQIMCLSLFVIMSLSLSQVTAQTSEEARQANRETINHSLDRIAQMLSVQLMSPDVRNLILEETQASRNSEQILDLETVVTQALLLPGGEARISLWDFIQQEISFIQGRVRSNPDDGSRTAGRPARGPATTYFNLYFPVDEHRRNWAGGDDLLVASAPVEGNDVSVGVILAYDVRSGNLLALPGDVNDEHPTQHTLVVGLDERESLEPGPPMIELPDIDPNLLPDEGEPVILVDPNDTNSWIGIPWIKLKNDHEPWWKGKAEIYVLVGQRRGSLTIKHKINLRKVNYAKRWYWLGDGPGAPMYFYFNQSYDVWTCFDFWEEDGGSFMNISVGPFSFAIGDDDDHVGRKWVDRNSIPSWSSYLTLSGGDVIFDVDKDH